MLVDGHLDLAYNALTFERDLLAGVAAIRTHEQPPSQTQGEATVALPELRIGGVGLVFATLFTLPASAIETDLAHEASYATPAEAHALARAQLMYYQELEARELVRIIRTRADLAHHQATWTQASSPLGLVLLMENADPITEPAESVWWAEQGVRLVGPAWQATRYCGGTKQPGPLTPLGRALLPELARNQMVLDVSHMAEESFWQAMDRWDGPVIASHSNCRSLAPRFNADRHLSDAMIKELITHGAVIGTVFFNGFLARDYQRGTPKERYGLDLVVRHIDHVCQLAGNARHTGLGTDLDGGLGRQQIPREIDTIADLSRVAEALSRAGFADADIQLIMGDNWLRMLAQALPE
ncbi:membrane dipeptidase [Candidatus Chloroploca sp. M-50]|uniref:Membrane dipeptidase n=1 Tax=Candidatus Chloroploca mongolica TaxID=2528176 RepID=A0ABS4D5V7_9CHLR|nr:membrane dipeptidase [Candidatus Chloroploca mongolica]MBP1464820.1 membrane dipeptidase [Candidatus Chloroploca mongolica]